jgi:hypothetical protein
MTSAKIRAYAGELDFGPTGNELFMGLKFSGANGHTVLLRNLGMRDTPLSFGVNSGASVTVVDSWGNETVVPVLDGTVAISLSQSPKYVLLSSTQTLTPPVFNYGSNLAPRAALEYSAPTVGKKPLSQVNNAVRETIHDGDNRFLWTGAMPQNADGTQIPQTLKATFAKPYVVDRSVIAGQRADNPHSLLLDFDLEGYRNGTRVLRVVVTTPFPQTELGRGRETTAVSWLQDNNIHALSFAPVEVDEMRLVVKRVTHGFAPDLVAAANVLRTWGHVDPPLLELKEWEIYGTPTDNALIGSGDGLQATYYPTVTLTGTPVVQVDPVINITSAPLGPLKGDNWSVRWQGYVQAEYSEDYTFFINMNDGARLWINDVQVINQWKGHSVHTEYSVTVPLVAGQKVPIRMEFYKGPSAGVAQLKWSGTSTPKQIVPQSQLYSTAGGATGGTSAPPVVEEGDLMGQWMSQGNGRYKARHTMPVAAGSKLEFVYDAPPVG